MMISWLLVCETILKYSSFNLLFPFCFDIDLRLKLVSEKKEIKEIPIKTFYGTERSSVHLIYALRFFLKTIKFKLLN